MSAKRFDLLVIGAGPGGYVAAIRASQLGMKVALVDKDPSPGGTCLRIGCIPSKALLESSQHFAAAQKDFKDHGIEMEGITLNLETMMKRKTKTVADLTHGIQALLKKNNIEHYVGAGRFIDPSTVDVIQNKGFSTQVKAKHILIATGSISKTLPGVEIDNHLVVTSTEALSFSTVPRHLVVIGAGAIGLELGSVWCRLGSQVTVVEYLDCILPGIDSEIAEEGHKIIAKQGINFRLRSSVSGVTTDKDRCTVMVEGSSPLYCDRVLVAVGRGPQTQGLNLGAIGIEKDRQGRLSVDQNFKTNVEEIYAIGDVIRGPMLAHKAAEEGIAVANHLAGQSSHVNYQAIPNVVYTHPEIASVGTTEDEIIANSIKYRKGVFPFKANGRAHASGMTSGLVKVLADQTTDRILGVHIIGPHAGEMINEASTAISFGASSEDLGSCCHAHPTLSEAIKEASLASNHRAIHF